MKELITAIAQAIKAGAEVYNTWLVSRDKRHMQAAIEAGEKYIFTNEDQSLTDTRRATLLSHYKKRFFHYN